MISYSNQFDFFDSTCHLEFYSTIFTLANCLISDRLTLEGPPPMIGCTRTPDGRLAVHRIRRQVASVGLQLNLPQPNNSNASKQLAAF